MALVALQKCMRNGAPVGPDRETVLLYGEAIAALGDTIAAIEEDNFEARCAAVCAATEAITTLYLNLDIRRCGESADDLVDLYGHILGRLIGINLYSDPGIARDVIELLEPLRDSWVTPDGMIAASIRPARLPSVPNGGDAGTPGMAVAPRAPAVAGNSR